MKLNKKKIILSAIFITSISIVGVSFADNPGPGAICQEHTLLGWGWTENVGSISFSCKNQAVPTNDYGVDIDVDGNLSGHAWISSNSSNEKEAIGWITFDRDEANTPPDSPLNDPCSDGSCTARFQGNKIIGWARAISACNWGWDAAKGKNICLDSGAGSNAGGWDGWIRFDLPGPNDAVSVKIGARINNPSDPYNGKYPLTGWASSGKDTAAERGVIGSISMNSNNTGGPFAYKVVSSIGPNQPPVADFECDNSGCNYVSHPGCICYDEAGSALVFNNKSNDSDDGPGGLPSDIVESRWYKALESSSFSSFDSIRNDGAGLPGKGRLNGTPGDYKEKLVVVDKKRAESLPYILSGIQILKGLKGDFWCSTSTDIGFVPCEDIITGKEMSVEEGKTIWFKDISTPSESPSHMAGSINSWNWTDKNGTLFGNGEVASTTASMNTSEITLAVTDTNNHTGSAKKNLKVIPLPRWREILPF